MEIDMADIRTNPTPKWSVEGTIISSDAVYGEGDTRHEALVAACLELPVEAKP